MAAVLLRRLIFPGSQAFVYPALAPATQSSLQALLLSADSMLGLSRLYYSPLASEEIE